MPSPFPAAVAAMTLVIPRLAAGQPGPETPLALVQVAEGLLQPVGAAAHEADLDRLFIIQQNGHIRLLDLRTGVLQQAPYLTVPTAAAGESGLLGLAFHPRFHENGYFFVYYTTFSVGARVARYRASGDPLTATDADPASGQILLTIPFGSNTLHIGGWIGFGPDGMLHIGTGDGTVGVRSQQIVNQLRGKLLRIDVDGPDGIPGNGDDDGFPQDPARLYTIPPDNPLVGVTGDDEIWAYGLRNPWRNDIDPVTGELYIADVGDARFEELNIRPANPPGAVPGEPAYEGGRNYGWPCYEANAPHQLTGCAPPATMTFPALAYGHTQILPPTDATGCSITGGVVYRGCAVPDLAGAYFFGDYCSGRIFSFRLAGGAIAEFRERTAELIPGGLGFGQLSSFGRDGRGEIYLCSRYGVVSKIVPAQPGDINGDGVEDSCRCPADWDGDGAADSSDISAFLTAWLAAVMGGTGGADYDRDGATTSSDISAFLASWRGALGGGC